MKKQKCKHNLKELSYMAWHAWAEEMYKNGERQTKCPNCGLWLFDCEK